MNSIYGRQWLERPCTLRPMNIYCANLNTENGYENYLEYDVHISRSIHRGTAATSTNPGLITSIRLDSGPKFDDQTFQTHYALYYVRYVAKSNEGAKGASLASRPIIRIIHWWWAKPMFS